uniref:protein CREG1-like n=1 Tax=Styela clava TaxID=7725 RepID=UPI00193A889E|nr:protein CREG1-like [Styela clava]
MNSFTFVGKFCLFCLVICAIPAQKIYEGRWDLKDSPPPHQEKAKTARYLVHATSWAVVATTSTLKEIAGRPFSNVFSFCDGPIENGTGIPYFYVTDFDVSMQDVMKNPIVSFTLSEAEIEYCGNQDFDPEDPRCARLTLSGKMVNVTNNEERDFALASLFKRHPVMKSWPTSHDFHVTKLEIDMIWLLDYFGGGSVVPLKDYFAANL